MADNLNALPEQPYGNVIPQGVNKPNGIVDNGNSNVPGASGRGWLSACVVGAVLVMLVVGGSAGALCAMDTCPDLNDLFGNEDGSNSDATAAEYAISSMLKEIKARNVMRCGVNDQANQGALNPSTGKREGFSVDLCRAIAAAIFREDGHVEYEIVDSSTRFLTLHSGGVDVLASATTHTMERELMESTSRSPFKFSVPYLYDGLAFGGVPEFVDCAENLDSTQGICSELVVCTLHKTTHEIILADLLPDVQTVLAVSGNDIYDKFARGLCNVMTGELMDLAEPVVTSAGYVGPYRAGTTTFSREPLCFVTREDDPVWSDFVNWVLQGLVTAEENNIDQDNATKLGTTDLFGEDYETMLIDAVMVVGNYGNVYDRHLGSILPRSGANLINDGSQPLHYYSPFGNRDAVGPDPIPGGTLESIRDRGFLRCGISRRAIFAEFQYDGWKGIDVDICKALSSAIFGGKTDTIEYTDLAATERFIELSKGTVDVLSRMTTVTFQRDVYEPTSETGFTFSQPYFYDGLHFGGVPPFGSCADRLDHDSQECTNLKICVNKGTTYHNRVLELFPSEIVFAQNSPEDVVLKLASGRCNAIAGGVIDVSISNVQKQENGYKGEYEIGSTRHTKDPLALVTRQDDPQWSAFCDWTLAGLFYAEENGITMLTQSKMPYVYLFGNDHVRMLRDAVLGVGSYKDIYDRNVDGEVPRGGPNLLNAEPFGPQHYALPGAMG